MIMKIGPFDHPDMARYIGRWYGKYRGIVVRNDDKTKSGRLILHIPSIHIADPVTGERPSSGWAFPIAVKPIMRIPAIDEVVWVEFEEGEIDRPLWYPGVHVFKNGIAQSNKHSRGEYDNADNAGGKSDGSMPTSQMEAEYGSIETWQAGNNIIEIDNSTGNERILISHKSGTRIEILSDGTVQNYTSGNKREVTRGGLTTQIDGKKETSVRGTTVDTYNGSVSIEHNKGLESIVIGDATYTYDKIHEKSKNKIIQITGKHDLLVGGTSSKLVSGKESNIISETASWVVQNTLGAANPLSTAINIHAMNGEILLKAGPLPLVGGVDHGRLLVGLARTQLLGGVVQIGLSEVLAIHPVARADVLLAYLVALNASIATIGTALSSTNPAAAGACATAATTLSGLIATIPSPTVLVS